MQEALAGFVAEVVGDEGEHHHADDVGGEGDGHDQRGQRNVADDRVVANDVEVEQAECFEGEQGVQTGAGIGHQQLVLADLQDDALPGDGVAHAVEHGFRHVGDGHLHWHGQGVHEGSGQRDHEQHEK